MFAVEVITVAAPDRAVRRLDLEEGINRLHSVEDMGIIRGPQTKTHQDQGIGTDDGGRRTNVLLGRAAFDGHGTLLRESCLGLFGWRKAHVVAFYTELVVQVSICHVCPAFDTGVPGVRRLSQVSRHAGFGSEVSPISSG